MTTPDLLAAIENVRTYRDPVDIDAVAWFVHVPRRTVESAIQQARLEGVPVITDGGLRVAATAAEAHALYRWLRARLATQNRTAWAVRSAYMLMERGERAAAKRAAETMTLGLVA